jgi:hypothetical protein
VESISGEQRAPALDAHGLQDAVIVLAATVPTLEVGEELAHRQDLGEIKRDR